MIILMVTIWTSPFQIGKGPETRPLTRRYDSNYNIIHINACHRGHYLDQCWWNFQSHSGQRLKYLNITMVLGRGGTMIGSSGQIHKRVEMDTHNVPKLVLSVVELLLQIFCLQDKRIMSINPQGGRPGQTFLFKLLMSSVSSFSWPLSSRSIVVRGTIRNLYSSENPGKQETAAQWSHKHFANALVKVHIAFHMIYFINRKLEYASFALLGRCLLACYAQGSLRLHCCCLNLIQDLMLPLSRLNNDKS